MYRVVSFCMLSENDFEKLLPHFSESSSSHDNIFTASNCSRILAVQFLSTAISFIDLKNTITTILLLLLYYIIIEYISRFTHVNTQFLYCSHFRHRSTRCMSLRRYHTGILRHLTTADSRIPVKKEKPIKLQFLTRCDSWVSMSFCFRTRMLSERHIQIQTKTIFILQYMRRLVVSNHNLKTVGLTSFLQYRYLFIQCRYPTLWQSRLISW